jgi:hypothetical protein
VPGGGGLSPSKVDDYSSSPAGRRVELSRTLDEEYRMDDEEEEGVMGLLFAANASGYCNCSLCAPERGEQYIPERNGDWRSWIAQQQGGGSYRPADVPAPPRASTTKTKTKAKTRVKTARAPVKKRPPAMMITSPTTNTQVFDSSWSATAVVTVSGEPLGNAFLQGNTAHVVPVQQPTVPPPPPAPHPPTSSTPEPAQKQEDLPDPDPDQLEQKKTTKGKGKATARRGRQGKKTRFFIGSLEPLLAAWKRNRRRRRQSASMDANADNPADDGDKMRIPTGVTISISTQMRTRVIGTVFAIDAGAVVVRKR